MPGETTRWHEPGPHRVADGVYRIPLSLPDDGLRAVNTYVIEDGPGVVLVDPGQQGGPAREELSDGLARLGYDFTHVHRCLVTHVHRDHYSNAVALRRECGCPVSLGEHERASIAAVRISRTYGVDPQLRALPLCGAAELVELLDVEHMRQGVPSDIWEAPDEWLADGDIVELSSRTLHVTHTPGHTTGHVTFHDREAGLLFSGDHILPRITPSIGFEPVDVPLPLADFLASLHRTLRAEDATLVPAHGPITQSFHQRVNELLAHHEHRLELVLALVKTGAETVYEVGQGLGWTRRERDLKELDPVNRMLAIMETKAHLDVLTQRNTAHCRKYDGLLRYAPTKAD
jgi:glyoxylase-like metal-dependent hydrolase (beta-lactamase superfamily II)